MRVRNAHTLAELIIVVAILATLAALATPRLGVGLVGRRRAESTAREIVTALRRARSLAISEAASNREGFALAIKEAGDETTYEIVKGHDQTVVDSQTIDSNITVSGRTEFEFGTLGTLKDGSHPSLTVSGAGKAFTISVIPATGMVKCIEN